MIGKVLYGACAVAMVTTTAVIAQPSASDTAKSPANKLVFDFAGGANIDPAKDMHMHEGSITIVDDDHIEWSWQGWQNGKPADGHKVAMKLVRKK